MSRVRHDTFLTVLFSGELAVYGSAQHLKSRIIRRKKGNLIPGGAETWRRQDIVLIRIDANRITFSQQ